jgi:hypothetical protein
VFSKMRSVTAVEWVESESWSLGLYLRREKELEVYI